MYPRLTDCWMQGLSSPGIPIRPGPRPDASANRTWGSRRFVGRVRVGTKGSIGVLRVRRA